MRRSIGFVIVWSVALGVAILLSVKTAAAQQAQMPTRTVRFEAETTSVLRNPLCGWGLYADVVWNYPDPETWWQGLEPGIEYATHFYHRCRWSTLEPEEGRYAWKHDSRFLRMIETAKKHGLKLAFRVIVDSRDNSEQATPDFVRKAGAKGSPCPGNEKFWNPHLDDPVFREKFSAFVKAFGEEFDDPDLVDYVDGNGLGWWGEQHHLNLPDEKKDEVLEWICSLYGESFKRVLLVYCFGSEFGLDRELRIAVEKHGYIPRRDGLGSRWFSQPEKDFVQKHFPRFPLVGESCYWNIDDWAAWKDDKAMNFQTPRDVLQRTVEDALAGHANTLDLRNPADVKVWLRDGKDLVHRFIAEGGYRLLPEEIEHPVSWQGNREATIRHRWINVGNGVCPNANPRWNKKYRVAFALFSTTESGRKTEPVAIHAVPEVEPSQWILGRAAEYRTAVRWDIPPGEYRLAIALVDGTRENRPGIFCSVKPELQTDGWVDLGNVTIK